MFNGKPVVISSKIETLYWGVKETRVCVCRCHRAKRHEIDRRLTLCGPFSNRHLRFSFIFWCTSKSYVSRALETFLSGTRQDGVVEVIRSDSGQESMGDFSTRCDRHGIKITWRREGFRDARSHSDGSEDPSNRAFSRCRNTIEATLSGMRPSSGQRMLRKEYVPRQRQGIIICNAGTYERKHHFRCCQ